MKSLWIMVFLWIIMGFLWISMDAPWISHSSTALAATAGTAAGTPNGKVGAAATWAKAKQHRNSGDLGWLKKLGFNTFNDVSTWFQIGFKLDNWFRINLNILYGTNDGFSCIIVR